MQDNFFHWCMMCVAQVSCVCNEREPSVWPPSELLHLVNLLLRNKKWKSL